MYGKKENSPKKNTNTTLRLTNLIKERSIDIDNITNRAWRDFCGILYKNRILVRDDREEIQLIDSCNYKFLLYKSDNAINLLTEIKNRRFLIIGMGGIGQVVLQHLVAAGFKKFILLDYDVVKIENFNRQFLADGTQIGIDKTQAVTEKLEKTYSDLYIKQYKVNISDSEILNNVMKEVGEVDMIVCAADYPTNEKIREIVIESVIKSKTMCVFAGVGLTLGEVGPLLNTLEAKKKYLKNLTSINESILYNPILKGSICFTNSFISIVLAYEIFKYYLGEKVQIENKTLFYDLEKMEKIKEIEWN